MADSGAAGGPEHHGQVVLTRDLGRWEAGTVGGQLEEVHSGSLDPTAPSSPVSPHRIHLMAGRVPQGADRAAVRGEMETVFLENLRHAAGVLAQVRQGKVKTHPDTRTSWMSVCGGGAVRHKAGQWPRSGGPDR